MQGDWEGGKAQCKCTPWKVSLPTAKAAQIACILDAHPYETSTPGLKQFHALLSCSPFHPDPCPHLPGTTLAAAADYDDDIL